MNPTPDFTSNPSNGPSAAPGSIPQPMPTTSAGGCTPQTGYGNGYSVWHIPPQYMQQGLPPFGETRKKNISAGNVYTGKDLFFALSTLLCGYLFCRAFPFSSSPLGATLFLLLLTAGAMTFLLTERKKQPKLTFTAGGRIADILFPAFLTLLSVSPVLQSGYGMRFWGALLYFALLFYYLGMSGGYCLESGRFPGAFFFFDALKTWFILPFGKCGLLFPALFTGGKHPASTGKTAKKRNTGHLLLMILCGLLIALIPTLIAGGLLSYDENFRQLIGKIFDFDFLDIASHIGSFILGIPLAMFLFSALFAISRGAHKDIFRKESCESAGRQMKFLPTPMSAAVFLPPLLLYLLFFISQREYYLSAFTGKLPEGEVFASYAREGFFNLCAVAAVNALLLLALSLFTKKREDGSRTLPERIGAILLSFATILLITTAMAKMVMYISVYGFSLLRLLASWAMLLLAVAFTLVIFAQLIRRLRLTSLLLLVFLLFTGALCTVDLSAITADYNAEAYISGSITETDLASIAELGESGIPALVRLAEAGINDADGRSAMDYIIRSKFYNDLRKGDGELSFFSLSLPRLRAQKALARIDKQLEEAYRDAFPGIDFRYN